MDPVASPEDSPSPEDYGLTPADYMPTRWNARGVPFEFRRFNAPDDWEPGVTQNRSWIRLNGTLPDDPVVHRLALTYLSDLTLLGTSVRMHQANFDDLIVASLDHAIWFHRDFRADEWLLYSTTAPSASGCLLYTSDAADE